MKTRQWTDVRVSSRPLRLLGQPSDKRKKWGMQVKMNLDRFNLNLFVAFEALCRAETLTQAAGELYVTQSTLSVALRQMREYFDDELFVYKPKQKELTPLAQSLRPRILEILKTAKATLMLKEDIAGESVAAQEMPEAAYGEPRVADSTIRRAFVMAQAQSHVPRRALKPRPLELDRRC
jgi:DNA-binding transcriptional LysR family regulator